MIVSGIHGNEVGSIAAAHKLVDDFKKGKLRINEGRLIIVPIVNDGLSTQVRQGFRERFVSSLPT
jgi:predicted deacylase